MKISIVTAVFNRQGTISECIASLQAQTHREIEHVVQDGGSTDGTLDVVRANADERTTLVSAPDGGIYDALNRAIARASGEVIGLLHSDDTFASPHVLEKVRQAFSDPAVDGVYGDLQYVSSARPDRVVRHWVSREFHPRKLRWGWMPPHPTLFLRRRVFDVHGMYDTSFRIAADYDAMLRWIGKGNIQLAYIPEVLVKMRLGGESNRSIERLVRKSREAYAAIRRNKIGGLGTLLMKNACKIGQFRTRRGKPV
jgi:glycosyltransferase